MTVSGLQLEKHASVADATHEGGVVTYPVLACLKVYSPLENGPRLTSSMSSPERVSLLLLCIFIFSF